MGLQSEMEFIRKKDRYWIVIGEKPAENPVRHICLKTAMTAASKLAKKYPEAVFEIYHVTAIIKAKAPELVEGQPSQGAAAGLIKTLPLQPL